MFYNLYCILFSLYFSLNLNKKKHNTQRNQVKTYRKNIIVINKIYILQMQLQNEWYYVATATHARISYIRLHN